MIDENDLKRLCLRIAACTSGCFVCVVGAEVFVEDDVPCCVQASGVWVTNSKKKFENRAQKFQICKKRVDFDWIFEHVKFSDTAGTCIVRFTGLYCTLHRLILYAPRAYSG
jgi:hypothetical protein